MSTLGEHDTAGGAIDFKQQDAGSSAEPVTPTKFTDNDQQSGDKGQPSQGTAKASNAASKTTKQRTTANSRK